MAGGHSRRFGKDDKLLADLGGLKLGLHTASRLGKMPWARKIAVARPPLKADLENLGYCVLEPAIANGLGDNLALAATALGDAEAALIVLADMPFITVEHIQAMIADVSSAASIVCTRTDDVRLPPVLIGKDHFTALRSLSGDQGAKILFAGAGTSLLEIKGESALTADIDTPESLERWLRH